MLARSGQPIFVNIGVTAARLAVEKSVARNSGLPYANLEQRDIPFQDDVDHLKTRGVLREHRQP